MECGVIVKAKNGNDGRRVLLQITPAGLAIFAEVALERRLIYDRIETHLGREQIDQDLGLHSEVASIND